MCDTVAVVRPGRVLLAKNSDRDVNEAQLLDWQPRRTWPEGAELECTWTTIPQVRQTAAVLLSRPFWMWGAEMGANEHGVVIGNEAVLTRQPLEPGGLTGMDLLRLALERAESAEEAVAVIRDLAARHGQGGRCGLEHEGFSYHSSYLVADAGGAFVLETAGRLSEAAPIEGVRAISNGLTLGGFAEAHSDRIRTWGAGAVHRRRHVEHIARDAEGPADLATVLRDHGAGRDHPRYRLFDGSLCTPCMHAGGVVINSQTTASWISELTPDGVRHWATATAAPCTGLFKPVRLDAPVDTGPDPTDEADDASLWWRHERLHRRIARDPETAAAYRRARDAVETPWWDDPPAPAEAFARGDELLGEWLARLPVPTRDRRPAWARRFWAVRDRRAGL